MRVDEEKPLYAADYDPNSKLRESAQRIKKPGSEAANFTPGFSYQFGKLADLAIDHPI